MLKLARTLMLVTTVTTRVGKQDSIYGIAPDWVP